jgi:hypothetical protein
LEGLQIQHLVFNGLFKYKSTLIPDTNFENRLIEIGIDSGILMEKLTANILTQTTLILGSFIKDLTGIKILSP